MLAIILHIENEEERRTAEAIWNQYEKRMYAVAKKILKKDEEANDAVMDAIHNVVRNIKKFVCLSELDTVCLLTVYVRNAALKIYNQNKKQLAYTVDSDAAEQVHGQTNVEEIVVTEEQYQYLSQVLQGMSERYAHPFILKHYYGFSLNEIATALDLKEETVKKQLYRAKQKLMEAMETRQHG